MESCLEMDLDMDLWSLSSNTNRSIYMLHDKIVYKTVR